MFAGQKPKERKKPLLTVTDVSQAFAVYPERPELIDRSTLIKLEGLLGDEEIAGSMKNREGWLLVMPELEVSSQNTKLSTEMLRWIVGRSILITTYFPLVNILPALHDAFSMYGRPAGWTWDPRDPASLMFGYPVGPNKEVSNLIFVSFQGSQSHL